MAHEEQYDAIIIGAGFSGIYQLIHLCKLGLRCTVVEAGSDLGGTWYWNRYPGARVDSHIPTYEFSLPELWKDWSWTEKFPGWQELRAYFAYVGDKLDIRPHCRFDTLVKQAHWDDQVHLWHVHAEGKQGLYRASARYLILCLGYSSKPYLPDIKGRDTFKGSCCHTSRWPTGGIETTGKRVGVIGTGASGIQVIQELGPRVAHLTVFQRTPNLTLPMRQYSMSKQVQDHFKPVYEELYKKLTTTPSGLPNEPIPRPLLGDSEQEREVVFERLWDLGGFTFSISNYQDLLTDKASNEIAYTFWRSKVSERITDPRKRELLAPAIPPHPLAAKRQSLEQNYYEIFNLKNVDLVDLKATPILEIDGNGVRTADQKYELDVLIFATGFDCYRGFDDIDLRGLEGKTIQDHWKDGVVTHLGLTIDNFPNLFFAYGPHGPTTANATTCIEIQGYWIVQTIAYLREHRITKFSPMTHAASTFKKHINALCSATLLPQADSWYVGANIPGKKREAYHYAGGLAEYRREIMAEIEHGYPGFLRDTLKPD